MGSLENEVLLKKDQQQNQNNINKVSSFSKQQRPRSRFPRFLLSKRLGYLQWISTIVVFSLFLVFFQAFLPGSVMETPRSSRKVRKFMGEDLMYLKNIIGELDFGEDVNFENIGLLGKFKKQANDLMNLTSGFKRGVRFGYRKPKLALVFADLAVDSYQLLMATVGTALQEIGYTIEVFSSEDGPAHAMWQHLGIPVRIVDINVRGRSNVDWLNYDGILLNSLEGKEILSCFMQEPFRSLPIIWTIHENGLATRLNKYTPNVTAGILNDWKKSFGRATAVVFPNYALPMIYSKFDTGNYLVIPGSPTEAWEAESSPTFNREHLYAKMGLAIDDFIVAIVGSQFMYKGLWLEHALILQALKPLLTESLSNNTSSSNFKIFILTGDSTGRYTKVVEDMSSSLNYPKGIVKHADRDANADDVLRIANLVIYGSFIEEKSFPDILIKAMSYEKLVIAPDLSMIQRYVDDRVNGYLFPKQDIRVLTAIVSKVISRGRLSSLDHDVSSIAKRTAKNLKAIEAVDGYASLLENILKLPSEVAIPKPTAEIPSNYKTQWRWDVLNLIPDVTYRCRNVSIYLDKLEALWTHDKTEPKVSDKDEDFLYSIWEEQKETDIADARKRREDTEIKDRTDQARGTWEGVYRNSRRADHVRTDMHGRDDGEIERTGQPLCIYEPYFGEGTWPFLHQKPLYRGISFGSRGRRRGTDDLDASSRLSLLNNPYYRDVLGEFGAFFAIANRVDRVHKNAWIGFQSWRETAKKGALSKTAENALIKAIEAREHGDTFYFWVRMDLDPRNPSNQDFWSFCDSINAGNCRYAFADAFKRMYGIKQEDWNSLPPMPMDGDTWSVMHSWALPTRSFLEFIMFSRMFVDALDAQMYSEHHRSGHCYLSLSRDKHCYSRVLELLVNVWAYHSARHMVFINPETGVMQEQHALRNRRGHMWVKFFSFHTLKVMDEDLAEEADSEEMKRRRWLWPKTGEIFWRGIADKERDLKQKEKADKKRKSKEKLKRIKIRNSQHIKPIDKYVKPPPDEISTAITTNSSTTTATARR